MTDATLPLTPSGTRTRVLSVLGDDRLASLAARGDAAAFAAIYERYLQPLHRYCQTIVGNPEDASDCLQTAMLKAFSALRASKRDIALKPWLYRIAHNESVSLLRRRRPQVESDEENMGWAPTAEADAATRERLKQLVGDLQELPERQRGAIVLRELGGFEVSELAEWLGSSEGAARQTLFQGRRSLQDYAEGRDMDCEDVRKAISDGDGRRFGNRKLRAHLRECEGCRDFRAAIGSRQSDLKVIAPPVPAALALGLVKSFFGGGGAGGAGAGAGVTGGAAAKGLGGFGAAKGLGGASVGAKVAATVAATAVVAGGAVGIGAVIDSGDDERPPGQQASQAESPVPQDPSPGSSAGSSGGAGGADDRAERRSRDRAPRPGSEAAASAPSASEVEAETATTVAPAPEGDPSVASEAPVPAVFTAPSEDLSLVAPPVVRPAPVADRPERRDNGRSCEEGADVQAAQTGGGCRSDCRTTLERDRRGRDRGRSRGGDRCRAEERARGDDTGDRNRDDRERGRDREERNRRDREEKDRRDREEKDQRDGKNEDGEKEQQRGENDNGEDREKVNSGEGNGRAASGPSSWEPPAPAMGRGDWGEGGAAPQASLTAPVPAPAPAPAPAAPAPVPAPPPGPAPVAAPAPAPPPPAAPPAP